MQDVAELVDLYRMRGKVFYLNYPATDTLTRCFLVAGPIRHICIQIHVLSGLQSACARTHAFGVAAISEYIASKRMLENNTKRIISGLVRYACGVPRN